uniref:Uncharacterized protein n=1 Tax=Oryza brachyantha TaxID=4533 RepID=J3MRM4_ORYBR
MEFSWWEFLKKKIRGSAGDVAGAAAGSAAASGGDGSALPRADQAVVDIPDEAEQPTRTTTTTTSRASSSNAGRPSVPVVAVNENDWRSWTFRFRNVQLHRLSNAGASVQDWLSQLITRTQKTVPLEALLCMTMYTYDPSFAGDRCFTVAILSCSSALVIDAMSVVMFNDCTNSAAVCWHRRLHCCLVGGSTVSMAMVPYLVLVSFGRLRAYVIVVAPLPAAAALIHHKWCGPPAFSLDTDGDEEDDGLDHVLEISWAVNNIATGGGLIGTIFGHSTTTSSPGSYTSPIGWLLFLTIFLALYLVLVATVEPPLLTRHAGELGILLLALLMACGLVAAVEAVGLIITCAVAAAEVVETALIHAAVGREKQEADGQKLTSGVLATVTFGMLMKLHSQSKVAASAVASGHRQAVRMVIYLSAFMWSANRMFFTGAASLSGAGAGDSRAGGGRAWAWLRLAVQWLRNATVVLAMLDFVCTFGAAAFFMPSGLKQ